MRILFICGSLEPAKDGVGDYVRRFAGELIRLGHEISVIAMNDQFIMSAWQGLQESESSSISVFRIPALWSNKRKYPEAKKWIDTFDPEWISLQFVPFSYQARGLTFGLSTMLKKLGEERKWHMMFHELWVGMNKFGPKKHILWGWIQRQLIKSMIRNINPNFVHTHTHYYKLQLAKHGFESHLIELFGNIPVIKQFNETKIENEIVFIAFGTLYPGAPIDEFTKEAELYSKVNKVNVSITLIGINGAEQERWKKACSDHNLKIKILGQQSIGEVSRALANSAIGITTTAQKLVEKSGSVAAMKEHRLPVICVAANWEPIIMNDFALETDILEYRPGNFEKCVAMKDLPSGGVSIQPIVEQFMDELRYGH